MDYFVLGSSCAIVMYMYIQINGFYIMHSFYSHKFLNCWSSSCVILYVRVRILSADRSGLKFDVLNTKPCTRVAQILAYHSV